VDPTMGFTPEDAGRLMQTWIDFTSKMVEATMSFSPQQAPPDALREIRTAQLNACAEYWQEWMRSPEFLAWTRQWLAGNVQMRKQLSEFLGQLQHEFQGASRQDIDQLMLSLRHLEQRIVDSTERISNQLGEFETRLAELEKSRPEKKNEDRTTA